MTKSIGIQLVIYSLILAGLSSLAYHLAPSKSQATLAAGLAGGALCLLWGLRAIMGYRSKVLPLLTLIPVSYVMLSQTVIGWTSKNAEAAASRLPVILVSVLLALSIAMLMRIAYAGLTFNGQPGKTGKRT